MEISKEVQLLVIGGEGDFANGFAEYLPGGANQVLHVKGDDWKSGTWQRGRSTGKTWALVAPEKGSDIQETVSCIGLIRTSFRPTRLVVMDSMQNLDRMLQYLKAGADGIISHDATTDKVFFEFQSKGTRAADYFPEPSRWLGSLVRSVQEVDVSLDSGLQLKRLLRLFVSQLGAERASIILVEGEDQLRLAVAIGFPGEIQLDTFSRSKAGAITDWVLRNGRSKLIVGKSPGSKPLDHDTNSAVCAPIISRGETLGVVNFSSGKASRQLTTLDLETTEVLAGILGMAIRNQRLMDQIVQSERLVAIGSTVGSVSHCLKNLLTIFKGASTLMDISLEKGNIEHSKLCFQPIRNGVRRIEHLVLDLLDLTKKREPEMKSTELRPLLEEIEEYFRIVATQNKKQTLEIRCNLEGEFMLDVNRLHRALLNLVSNSLDASPFKGVVRLAVARERDKLLFTVSDNGHGVPPEKLPTIFDVFYSTKGSAGTGLGLAFVAKFVQENGGTVSADHDPDLNGLRVTITLPRIEGDDQYCW